jgi:PAS domain S-box-containing protein
LDQALEEFNLTILNNLPNPILAINPDTSIKYVNPAFEEMTGFFSEELIGLQAPYPWWTKSIREKGTIQLLSKMRMGEDIERYNHRKKGGGFWVKINSKPVFIDGEFKFFLSNWTDITERKKVERQRNKLNRELRYLSQHLQYAREQERQQIAREVHDELGQTLAALKMDICWLEKKLDGTSKPVDQTVKSMTALVDTTLQKVKWISAGLRPSLLDDLGLSDAIEWLASQFQNATGIICDVCISEKCNNLDRDKSISIYRVFQEALTNISVHAHATNISIILKKTSRHLVLEIQDNGIGIAREQLSDPKAFGLLGMRESVHSCGGQIAISGIKDKGTSIQVKIPLNAKEKLTKL